MSDIPLPEGDYVLTEGVAWITADQFSVYVRVVDDNEGHVGAVVELYPLGDEAEDPPIDVATAWRDK